jgi:hypothetical protein
MKTSLFNVPKRSVRRRRPVNEAEGPWLIWSHYWGSWHRRSDTGGAAGYTNDVAQAGVFDFAKAREYHDYQFPNGRDEAVPRHRVKKLLQARAKELEAERQKIDALIAEVAA